jgi:hypothetical protein
MERPCHASRGERCCTSRGRTAVSGGPVAAQPRDPCADRAHQAQVALDIAHGWWVVGNTLTDLGDFDGADDAYAYADYFYAEYEMYTNDAC